MSKCIPDEKEVFKEKKIYTEFCSVCECYVKLYKFRGCEKRHDELKKQGVDVFAEIREKDKIAAYQMGISPKKPSGKATPQKKKKSRRRGR